jgi:hypothetical protein
MVEGPCRNEPDVEQEGRRVLVHALIEGPTYLKGWNDYLSPSVSSALFTISSGSYYSFMLHDG